jgi:hypothetical protein
MADGLEKLILRQQSAHFFIQARSNPTRAMIVNCLQKPGNWRSSPFVSTLPAN